MSQVRKGDRVKLLPNPNHPTWMQEMAEIDPTVGTVLDIQNDKARIAPKMGDDPFWVELNRVELTDF